MLTFGIILLLLIIAYAIWQYFVLKKLPIEVEASKQEFLKPAFDALCELHNFRPYVSEIAINKGPFYKPHMCLEYTGNKSIVEEFMSNKINMDKVFSARESLSKKLIEKKLLTLRTVYRVFLDKDAEPICLVAILDANGNHIYLAL